MQDVAYLLIGSISHTQLISVMKQIYLFYLRMIPKCGH
jgi:hypothetical protein